jgi:hypothetical protein
MCGQVVEAAGQEGPPGQQRLQQAQDLAARYGLDAWPLAVRYGEACLLAPGLADADVQGFLQARTCSSLCPAACTACNSLGLPSELAILCHGGPFPTVVLHDTTCMCQMRSNTKVVCCTCAQGVQPQLLERPMEALQVLVGRVWERLPDCGHARLTLVLDLTHKCLSRMVSSRVLIYACVIASA